MAVKQKLSALVLAGLLSLGLNACSEKKPKSIPNFPKNAASEYAQGRENSYDIETISSLEGKIIKVQSSILSYCGENDKKVYGSRISANHEFEYVVMERKDGKLFTLIYPYTKVILERDAMVTYRPLANKIDAETFIDTFLNPDYFTDDNVFIEADGIIAADGIYYIGNKQGG